MKKLQVFVLLLLVVLFASSCIFSDGDKASSGSSNSLVGTWGLLQDDLRDRLDTYNTITFQSGNGFQKYSNTIEKDGSLTLGRSSYGLYEVEGSILYLYFKEFGETTSTVYYSFSVSGNKLTLDGVVWTKEK